MRNSLQGAKAFAILLAMNALAAGAQSPRAPIQTPANKQVAPLAASQTPIRRAAPGIDQPLTLSQRWAMACPALLAAKNQERLDSFDIWERKPEYIEAEKKALIDWWGISNREDLLHMLNRVDEQGGHRKLWKEMAEIKNDADAAVFKAKYHEMKQEAFDRKLEIVRKYDKMFGSKGILAWDYCRLIALCRWGVYCDYITKDEAWRIMMPAARVLQRDFKSWEDLGLNYVVARRFWSQKETQDSGSAFEANLEKLIKDPKSDWSKIPWNTDLAPKVSNGY